LEKAGRAEIGTDCEAGGAGNSAGSYLTGKRVRTMLMNALLFFGLVSITVAAVQFLAYFRSLKPKGYSEQKRIDAMKQAAGLRSTL
jgi:hypothetical protein